MMELLIMQGMFVYINTRPMLIVKVLVVILGKKLGDGIEGVAEGDKSGSIVSLNSRGDIVAIGSQSTVIEDILSF